MARSWQRWLGGLTPGGRLLVGLVVVTAVLTPVGRLTQRWELAEYLGMSGPWFWHGQVWRAVTYVLVPGGWVEVVMNPLAIAWLALWLQRVWPARDLWWCSLVAAACGSLVLAGTQPASPGVLVGGGAMVTGLLVAGAFVLGHERVMVMGVGEMFLRTAALGMAGFGVVMTLLCCGLIPALVCLAGGAGGWLYVCARRKFVMGRESRVVGSERMSRLEL